MLILELTLEQKSHINTCKASEIIEQDFMVFLQFFLIYVQHHRIATRTSWWQGNKAQKGTSQRKSVDEVLKKVLLSVNFL